MAEIGRTSKRIREAYVRGLLLSILEKNCILTKVRVFNDGRLTAETKDWNAYWQSVHEFSHEKIEESLDTLHSAWQGYICSGFSVSPRREFCYRYFTLLETLLTYHGEFAAQAWLHALHITLGFECFGIYSATNAHDEVLAAGTSTLRNPCYLLARLKMPDVLDDPQFLPIITVAGTEKPELFYHYRQYTLSNDSPMSLLLYPLISNEKRSASFRLINSLSGSVSQGIDPRTRERAQRLCKNILYPIMQSSKSGLYSLEFEDIGAGSGSLGAAICHEIQNLGFALKVRLHLIDLEPADPARFFRTKNTRNLLDNLTFLGDDYRDWLSRPQPLPPTNTLRIALISKLFNNLSRFSIRCLHNEDLPPLTISTGGYSDLGLCHPSICLAPGGHGVKALVISNSRVPLLHGRTFAQMSLSQFYRGLYLLSKNSSFANSSEVGFFLPVRSFNTECLVTWDNQSVISRLAENCDYIIIEDADLRPKHLIDHAVKFSLNSLTICDMTKALKLKGNYLYVICAKKEMNSLLLGEHIW
ncbi:MAG: hypothetical protein HY670_08710 [Chloroflexi bacterium]|nr:hypothetical protein [Chloroflexota bacterium]